LHNLAERRSVSLNITLISTTSKPVCWDSIADFVASNGSASDCEIPLAALLQRSGASLITASVTALDAHSRQIALSNGQTLLYDVLSLDTDVLADRVQLEAHMPGASQQALSLWPLDVFCKLWPQLTELSTQRALNVAVIGDDVHAVELALAAQQGLAGFPGNLPQRVTLVFAGQKLAPGYPEAVQRHLAQALKTQNITVLWNRCTGIRPTEVLLENGARLACDAPLLAAPAPCATWLAGSGLALTDSNRITTTAQLQSVSHPQVFASSGTRLTPDELGVDGDGSVRHIAKVLTQQIRAVLNHSAPVSFAPPRITVRCLFIGKARGLAILQSPWGVLCVKGSWFWRWKQRAIQSLIKAWAE
jgi:selenide,water dikinase